MREEGGVARLGRDHDAVHDYRWCDLGEERCCPGRQLFGRLANNPVCHRGLVTPQDLPHLLGEPRVIALPANRAPSKPISCSAMLRASHPAIERVRIR
jgi:hypothetical protein